MADDKKPAPNDDLLIAAAVFGVVAAVVYWILTEHPAEANKLFRMATRKVETWLD